MPLYEDYWGDLDGYFEACRPKLKNHDHSAVDSHLKVAVRCRPLDAREKAIKNRCIVTPNEGAATVSLDLTRIVQGMESATFAYDHVYGPESRYTFSHSLLPEPPAFSENVGFTLRVTSGLRTQPTGGFRNNRLRCCGACVRGVQRVDFRVWYVSLSLSSPPPECVEPLIKPTHVLNIAGQTSSGKTFSMMGIPKCEDVGLIPRICRTIFHFVDCAASEEYEVFCLARVLFFFVVLSFEPPLGYLDL